MPARLKHTAAPVVGAGRTPNEKPMKRTGEMWDVAGAAVPLASGEARYITGVASPMDRELSCEG
jgi:NAD(P)-dependent dehydrogenase (short-subunit alcohol dehydrogenase family)